MKEIPGRRVPLIMLVLILAGAFLPLSAQDRGMLVVQAKDGSRLGSFKASYALVIGETQYRAGWPKLPGVGTDVKLVSKALEDQGFAVTLKQDLGFEELKNAYEDFIEAYGFDEGNRLLFYYAGHGHTLKLAGDRDMGYIVPVDAPNPNQDATGFKKKSIAMQQFDTWAKGIESRHALFLFDSCFSGSIFAITRAVPANINEKTVNAVRQFITSGSAEEQVPDKSVFRDQFVAGIAGEADRNGDGYVTGAELGEFLDEKVVNYSNASQHPQYGKIRDAKLDKGDFVFAVPVTLKATQVQTPSPAPTPAKPRLTVARSYGSLVINAATAGELYLDGASLGELPAGSGSRLDDVEAGERKLEMRYPSGEREALSVTVQKGAQTPVVFAWMKVQTGMLTVRTDPPGARVLVNGSDRGQSPLTLRDLSLGYVSISVSQSGYEDISQQKLIEAGKTTEVAYVLKKKAPALAPSGSAVAVDGFVRVPAGSFTMGSPASEPDRSSDEGPQHEVRLSAFAIGQYEVTQGEWKAVMGSNPSRFTGNDRLPVEQVSWYDILVYCNKRSLAESLNPCYSISGSSDPARWGSVPTSSNSTWNAATCDFSANGYRLPTEAEWEYACRAGTKTATAYGNTLVSSQANFDGNNAYNASTKGPYLQKTLPVGSYQPNAWGIYDMHGNVWEWCWDCYGSYSSGSQSDPRGSSSESYRVLRGGCWRDYGQYLRSSSRHSYFPFFRNYFVGFRVVVGR